MQATRNGDGIVDYTLVLLVHWEVESQPLRPSILPKCCVRGLLHLLLPLDRYPA